MPQRKRTNEYSFEGAHILGFFLSNLLCRFRSFFFAPSRFKWIQNMRSPLDSSFFHECRNGTIASSEGVVWRHTVTRQYSKWRSATPSFMIKIMGNNGGYVIS